MKINKIILILIVGQILTACEPELDLALPAYQSRLVVDGWIEQGQFPQVTLTRSSSYFENIDSTSIRRFVVSTAKVTVSDGEKEEILTYKKNNDYFPPYIYRGTSLKGEVGKTYTLKVELSGEVYTATTTIPAPAYLDSLWFEQDKSVDTIGIIYGKFKDNPEEQNFYRAFTKRENKDKKYVPIYYSAVPDIFFNGQEFSFSLLRGSESLSQVENDLYFAPGDTVMVKFCTFDKAHYEFWATLENELYIAGNPFASSGNKIKSNISNNALGVWGGYGATYYRVIAR